jgi:hypothetical protein
MSHPSAAPVPQRTGRVVFGVLLGLAGHALALAVGYVAGRVVGVPAGGGFQDLAAVVVGFLGTELLVALACVVAGTLLLARDRKDLGAGLLVGWVLGAVAIWFAIGRR